MSDALPVCPQPPDWQVDWDGLNRDYPWLRSLAGCPQDPVFHGEGDVWIHTRMVCEAMAALPVWRELSAEKRRILFAAALLHDVGKPDRTRLEPDGRITSRGHALRGSIMARRILWSLGVPFGLREQVTGLVRQHMRPFYLLDRGDSQRLAIEISQTTRCADLAILAEADARGRIAPDQQRLLDNVGLFAEFCQDQGCLEGPRTFVSEHARFLYFQDPTRHPDSPAHEAFRAEVVLLSGLPGSGKDHWIAAHLPHWPLISLDALRDELDVAPTDTQGPVLSRARELARGYLRQGRSFVWNATNISRQLRRESVRLFAGYNARVRIVYVEVPEADLHQQNRRRAAVVPRAVIERFLDRWEVPDVTEAHCVEWVVRS
jgi:putative nucleotidyltransferase with HDIG domain